MPTYNYKGINQNGKDVKGVKEAVSKTALTTELAKQGIFLSDISEITSRKNRFESILSLLSRKKNLADIFFQLSLLLRSGIPLVDALKIISKSIPNEKFRSAILESASRVSEGMRFSDSLAKHPDIFDSMYVNLIRASEHVGKLSSVLLDIAEYEENKKKNSDKLSSAMIYPTTILIMGMGVIGFLLTFVVPKMESIFKSMKQALPPSTTFLLGLSKFFTDYGLIMLLFILFLIFLLRYNYRNNIKFRLKVDKKLFSMNIISTTAIAKFAHVLAFQLREGLPLTDALMHANDTLSNRYLQEIIKGIRESVQSGTKFSVAVRNAGIFPELFPAAVSTGESSGNMPELLDRVNEFYSKQVDKFITSFLSLIEPVFIVVIGLAVGFIIISVMQPLLQINSMVQ